MHTHTFEIFEFMQRSQRMRIFTGISGSHTHVHIHQDTFTHGKQHARVFFAMAVASIEPPASNACHTHTAQASINENIGTCFIKLDHEKTFFYACEVPNKLSM
jgi:hypothetical protein